MVGVIGYARNTFYTQIHPAYPIITPHIPAYPTITYNIPAYSLIAPYTLDLYSGVLYTQYRY